MGLGWVGSASVRQGRLLLWLHPLMRQVSAAAAAGRGRVGGPYTACRAAPPLPSQQLVATSMTDRCRGLAGALPLTCPLRACGRTVFVLCCRLSQRADQPAMSLRGKALGRVYIRNRQTSRAAPPCVPRCRPRPRRHCRRRLLPSRGAR